MTVKLKRNLVLIVFLIFFMTITINADNSGTCGENVTWRIEGTTLIISGTGAMTDYDYFRNSLAPWHDTAIETVVINDGVTTIGNHAFYLCGLNRISIPDSVTSIGDCAFCYCSNLTSISIPDGVTSIGRAAFEFCDGLTSVPLPNSVLSIGDDAFGYCKNLIDISIPDGVTTIGNSTFENCQSLSKITISDSVTNIGNRTFYCCSSLTNITIPNSVISIGWQAFDSCSGLTSITLPSSLISIGSGTFSSCGNLTDITLPSSVIDIGSYAFRDCRSLTSIIIPNSVTSIGDGAFRGCNSLTDITIPNGVTGIGDYTFYGCSGLTDITIPNDVTSIGDYVFRDCSSLESITLPRNMTSLGEAVFQGCSSLTSIEIPNGVTSIGYSTFYNCSNLTSVVIPNSVTHLGNYAFRYCSNLKEITIPNGVTTIDDFTFEYCQNLSKITIPSSVTSICRYAFSSCSSLTSITIPDSVTSIGDAAFSGCGSLTSITIPDSVTSIGNGAFSYCGGVTSITIPSSVTSIGSYAFSTCKSLTNITIPCSVTSIGSYVCRYSDLLSDVYYAGSEEQWQAVLTGNAYEELTNATIHYNCSITPGIQPNEPTTPNDGMIESSQSLPESAHSYTSFTDKTWTYSIIGSTELEVTFSSDTEVEANHDYIYIYEGLTDKGTLVGKYTGSELAGKTIIVNNDSVCIRLTSDGSVNKYGFRVTKIAGKGNNAPYVLESVVYEYGAKKVDVLSTAYSIKNDHGDFMLRCTLFPSNNTPARYELYADGRKIAESTDGCFKDISPAIIYPNRSEDPEPILSIRMTDDKGKGCATNILLSIKKDEMLHKYLGGSSLSIGESIALTLDDDIPLIGGHSLSLNIPEVPVNVVLEEGKIKIGVNIDKDNLYSYDSNSGVTTDYSIENNDWKKRIDDWKKELEEHVYDVQRTSYILQDMKGYLASGSSKADFPGFQEKINYSCIGYGEGTWSDSLETISVSLIAAIEGTDTFSNQLVVVYVPITLQCQVKVNVSTGVELKWNFVDSDNLFSGTWTISPDVSLELYGGVGAGRMASLGVYGQAGLKTDIVIVSTEENPGLKTVCLYGDVGIKGFLAMKEMKLTLLKTKQLNNTRFAAFTDSNGYLYLYSNDSSKVTVLNPNGSNDVNAMLMSISEEQLVDLYENPDNYSVTVYNLEDDFANDVDSENTVLKNSYGDARPTLVSAGGKQFLIYVGSDTHRPLLDQTVLQYMIYDETTGTFSNPMNVDQDSTADYGHTVYTDGTDLYIAYLNAKQSFTDEISLEDYSGGFSIQVMRYDMVQDCFVPIGSLGTEGKYCYNLSIAAVASGIKVSWTENSDNNVFGATENNSIYYADYRNGLWETTSVDSGENCIGNLVSFTWDGIEYTAFSVDNDGNLLTSDSFLCVKASDGDECRYDIGKIQSLQFTELPGISGKVLAWNNNGSIQYLSSYGGSVQTLVEGLMKESDVFEVVNGKIYFTSSNQSDKNVYAAICIDNNWTVISVTEENGYVNYFSLDGDKIVYLSTMDIDAPSNIKLITQTEKTDISVAYASVDYWNVQPSRTLTVSAFVTNKGTRPVSELIVTIGQSTKKIYLDETLLPGKYRMVEIPFTLPDSFSGEDYVLEIYAHNETVELMNDNIVLLGLNRTELSIDAEYIVNASGNYIKAIVQNKSCVGTDATVFICDKNGNSLTTKTIWVDANSSEAYYFDINDSEFGQTSDMTMTVRVESFVEEYNTTNNEEGVRVWRTLHPITTIIEGVSMTLTNKTLTASVAISNPHEYGIVYDATQVPTLETEGRIRIVFTELSEGKFAMSTDNPGYYRAYVTYSGEETEITEYSDTIRIE